MIFVYNKNSGIYHCPADRSTVTGRPDVIRNRSYNMSNSIRLSAGDHFDKFTEIPNPAGLFVFIDTHEGEIWDSTFGVYSGSSPWSAYWIDIPADRHQQGAGWSFADGHAELARWKTKKDPNLFFRHAADANAPLLPAMRCERQSRHALPALRCAHS